MLRIAAPHVQAWNSWFADSGNRPDGVAPLRALVDEACREVGRDPAQIARTVTVLVRLPGGRGRTMGDTSTSETIRPLAGGPDAMAAELRAYADAGIDEVQLVLDPIDRLAIERFAPVLGILDGG